MGSTETAGNKAALQNANAAYKMYNSDMGNWKNQYNQYRTAADQAWGQDYGNSAADFMGRANKAGIQSANQQLDAGARAATNQAQLASRTAGLSKGQAAMNAAGAANNMYQNNWGNAVQQGAQNYGNAAQMNQQQKQSGMTNAMQGMGLASQGMQGAMGTQAGVGANQTSEWDKNMGIMGTVGGLLSSDERVKEDIEPEGDNWIADFTRRLSMIGSDERIKEPIDESPDLLEEVAEKINNYTYHYKPGTGEDPSIEHSGPMAQELLEVDGYRAAVFEDENGLLQVDTGRLAMVNTGMIADLSKRLLFLEDFIRTVMDNLPQIVEEVVAEPEQVAPDVE